MSYSPLFKSIFLLFTLFTYLPTFAQEKIWHLQQKDKIDFSQDIRITPNAFLSYTIHPTLLQQQLAAAPHEEDYLDHNVSPLLIELPNPDGGFSSFHIIAYDLMEEDLKSKWSFLKNWRGWQVDNPQTTIRLDWTAKGFHAMVYEKGKHWYIDPLYWEKIEDYQVFYKKDYPAPSEPFQCKVENQNVEIESHHENSSWRTPNGDCNFRTYRTAIACTGEYTTFHGGTIQGAASAINTSLNRLNGVYESELALRLILIANNDLLIYLDESTDPYTNSSGSAMLGQNQQNIDQVIGNSNYDIGHVYSTGGGGVANLRSPCNSNLKARGVTGRGAPVGDPFDIDYVAHEMGHQFGGNHTQNSQCNRNPNTAVEPGSASTIMGYAGVCSPNIQNYSDAYYHGISIQEISNYMQLGGGAQCATIIDMSNTSPSNVQAGEDKFIPANTPFVLIANATDSDQLSYNWEQFDTELAENTPPQSSNTQGPLFRSFYATASPSRYFPRLVDLANNVDPTWEELPGVSRDMTFRVTVRDLSNAYACSSYDEITLSVEGGASDFSVIEPNGASVEWEEYQTYPVTWKVAGTDVAPINCTAVDIFLSLDGGLTYPIRLDSAVANNGSTNVTLPEIEASNQARVMVKCSDNVFFNISNTNFTVIDQVISLPLDWISFEAFAKQNNGLLNWKTENENNVSHFEVERRTAEGNFKKIGRIEAANGREQNTYEFVDKQLISNTIYYYRIKQIDFNNAYSFSTIKSIQLKTEKPPCTISPNPNNGIFSITIEEGRSLPSIRIFNTLGQEVAVDISLENDAMKFSLKDKNHSFYILLLEWDTGETMVEKVLMY